MATGRLPDPNTAPLTAKGDLYTYSTVPARLAVGSNGDTLVADSSATTGLRWQGNFAAGKNAIINGDFRIWQRGTSFTSNGFAADRFRFDADGTGSTNTISQQTFTPGTAPVAGYEGAFFLRMARSAAGSGNTFNQLKQAIEDVRTFAGQTITVSFWAKADTNRTLTVDLYQNFGSGGSATSGGTIGTAAATTSWTRFSITTTLASVSGKTIGTSSFLQFLLSTPTGVASTIDIWGVQIEAGSVATAFQTATGTLAGELAACQRYLPAFRGEYSPLNGFFTSTTAGMWVYNFPVTARVAPTGITISAASDFQLINKAGAAAAPTGITFNYGGVSTCSVSTTHTAGSPTAAQGEPGFLRPANSSAYILFTGCEL